MTLKTILVSLNSVERADAVMRAAVDLAIEHDAHLIGLFVIPAMRIYPVVTMHVPPEFFEAQRKTFEKQAADLREVFEDYGRKNGLRYEWRQEDALSPLIADTVIEHARRCDLLIASQPLDDEVAGVEGDFAERIIMETGRPVLFIPNKGEYRNTGRKIVAGWNASREATRAIYDALPLLAKAGEVRLAWIDPQRDEEESGDLPGAEMAASLARHDINAVADDVASGGLEAGEVLLNHVADTGSDMLVCGAWGHSRLREYVFGGVTQHLLKHMTVPVLFSH